MQLILHPAEGVVPGIQGAGEIFEMIEKKFLELTEPEEKVLLVAELGSHPADRAGGFPDLSGLKVPAAPLVALVSPGRSPAVRTDPFDIAVRQGSLASDAIALLDYFRVHMPVLDELLNDGTGPPVVRGIIGHPEMVKFNLHPSKSPVEVIMVAFGKFPG
jgi:hypothetical protein